MEIYGRQIFQRLSIGASQRNTLTFLPDDFETSNRLYPLLLVHPGSGEVSQANNKAGVSNLLRNGIPRMIAEGWNPYTAKEKFIVFTVQQDSIGYAIPPDGMMTALENNTLIAGRYRKDAIFVTGLSLGACATCFFFENKYAEKYLPLVAGLIPMSGVELGNQDYDFDFIKKNPVPVWGFCGTEDTAPRVNFMKAVEQNVPGIVFTWYNADHSGWINQYKNARHNGMSILEWCASLIPGTGIPEQPIKVISSTPTKIVVEGPALSESRLLKLGAVDVQYNVV